MLTGSVAATLIGLIFVSVSLHIDVIASARKDSDIRAMHAGRYIGPGLDSYGSDLDSRVSYQERLGPDDSLGGAEAGFTWHWELNSRS